MTAQPLALADRIKRLIGDELGIDPAKLEDGDRLINLGATDLKLLHIGLSMEDAVDAEASDDDLERCKTVGDYCRLAERLAGESAVAA